MIRERNEKEKLEGEMGRRDGKGDGKERWEGGWEGGMKERNGKER